MWKRASEGSFKECEVTGSVDLKQGAAVHTGLSPPGPLHVKVQTRAPLGTPAP